MVKKSLSLLVGHILLVCFLFSSTSCTLLVIPEGPEDLTPVELLTFLVVLDFLNPCLKGSDPYLSEQWHLENTGQTGGTSGEDIGVRAVWNSCVLGPGVIIAVVDDGIDDEHEDLVPNLVPFASHSYVSNSPDLNSSGSTHGTSVAGVIGARDSNGIGVRGVAPRAGLVGFDLLQNYSTVNEADAMTRHLGLVHISNNSWGPDDYVGEYSDSPSTWKDAIRTGLSLGRFGKGILYFWAAGNGGDFPFSGSTTDNSNYDGYANYYGVFAVCAVDHDGVRSGYSEKGANLLVCAPSNKYDYTGHTFSNGIVTTDVTGDIFGWNTSATTGDHRDYNYTQTFGGTSSASPIAAGVAGLMLNVNPFLGWRDVKMILARTARKNDPNDSDWTTNGAGHSINHKYGFGVVNAAAAVDLARFWNNVGPLVESQTYTESPGTTITDNDGTGITRNISVSGAGLNQIEFVEIGFTSSHPSPGELEITLTSPSGTTSILAENHTCHDKNAGYAVTQCTSSSTVMSAGWNFGSMRHLDESPTGTWTLTVKDRSATYGTSTLGSWSLKFYGRL